MPGWLSGKDLLLITCLLPNNTLLLFSFTFAFDFLTPSISKCLYLSFSISLCSSSSSSLSYHRPVYQCGAEDPAEDDILTVSCSTANKRTFLNDELLLCKWLLTDTVSARQSPVVRSAVAEPAAVIVIIFMIAGSSQRGDEGRGGRGYGGLVGLFTSW